MSWSVSSTGTPAEVRGELSQQFKGPLAEGPAGLADAGERQTVQQTSDLIEQILSTFDPAQRVTVAAHGHMGFGNWDEKTGCYQNVNLSIAGVA
jgi:hypothetical protein